MSSLDPSSPAFTSMARRRSAPERILSIEGPAQDHCYTSCRLDVRVLPAALPVGETRLGAGGFEQLGRPASAVAVCPPDRTGMVCALLGHVTSTSTPDDREARD